MRSLLRIEQNREQPIDKFVKVLWIYKGKLAYDPNSLELMNDPKIVLKRLSGKQLEDIIASTSNFEKTERKLRTNEFVEYWVSLRSLAVVVLQ